MIRKSIMLAAAACLVLAAGSLHAPQKSALVCVSGEPAPALCSVLSRY